MFEILIFWNLNFLIIRMNLDGEITKTEVVDLNEIYNFVADDLSIWNHLWFQNSVLCSYILKFIISNYLNNSDEEITLHYNTNIAWDI